MSNAPLTLSLASWKLWSVAASRRRVRTPTNTCYFYFGPVACLDAELNVVDVVYAVLRLLSSLCSRVIYCLSRALANACTPLYMDQNLFKGSGQRNVGKERQRDFKAMLSEKDTQASEGRQEPREKTHI